MLTTICYCVSPRFLIVLICSFLVALLPDNSFHVFAAVRRKYFDLEGVARFSNICRCNPIETTYWFLQLTFPYCVDFCFALELLGEVACLDLYLSVNLPF